MQPTTHRTRTRVIVTLTGIYLFLVAYTLVDRAPSILFGALGAISLVVLFVAYRRARPSSSTAVTRIGILVPYVLPALFSSFGLSSLFGWAVANLTRLAGSSPGLEATALTYALVSAFHVGVFGLALLALRKSETTVPRES